MPATPRCYQKVTHCIFDCDGTLLDTETRYAKVIQKLLASFGKTYTYDLKLRLMGMSTELGCRLLVKELNLPIDEAELSRRFQEEVLLIMSELPLMPGVKELLLHLHENRVPMAVATSSTDQALRLKMQTHCDLLPSFYHIVCGNDPELKRGKPAPDIFLLAASRFNPQPRPECCLVFEDSPTGMKAAIAAGMQVVMIPEPEVPSEKTKGATLVLNSMAEFEPELFGLPPYDNCSKFTFG